ncbi:hypothetical protein BH09PAT2_BH09PAT2_06450 [soil metagenome]
MSITPEDIQTIKGLLNEVKQDISADTERKIDTATTNLETNLRGSIKFETIKTQVALQREIRTSEDNLNKRMDDRFENVNKQFDIVNEKFADIDKRFTSVDNKIDNLETNMYSRFDEIDETLEQMSLELVRFGGQLHEDHEKRIVILENKQSHSN